MAGENSVWDEIPARRSAHGTLGFGFGSISQRVFIMAFFNSQFPHKCVNLVFVSVMIKDKLTDLCGNGLFQNDCTKKICETRVLGLASSSGLIFGV